MVYNTLAIPEVNDLEIVSTTNTTITMTWTSPSFGPQIHQPRHQCCRLCEHTYDPNIHFYSISSPYTFTGINPSTVCTVGLNGIYGSDIINLIISARIATTLLSGKYNTFSHPQMLSCSYTSVGPGEWSDTQISTSNIRRSLVYLFNDLYPFLYSYSFWILHY